MRDPQKKNAKPAARKCESDIRHLASAALLLLLLDLYCIPITTSLLVVYPRGQQPEAINLPDSSPGLQLLQRIRDEAHRFALSYHQRLRRRETFASSLDTVPGIGPSRKRALLKQFGTIQSIRDASTEELTAVGGINQSLARTIKESL